jgi:DNA-binding PadR family transcriptional regulator
VYAALDQLEARGHVRGVRLGPGEEHDGRLARRSTRITYEITDAGMAAFDTWMARPSERHEPVRSELQLKMAVARTADQPLLIEAIAHQARLTQALLSQFSPVDGCTDIVRRAATARLQSDLVWLAEVRERLSDS